MRLRFPSRAAAVLLACAATLSLASDARAQAQRGGSVMSPWAPRGAFGAPLAVRIDVLPGDDANTLVAGSDEGIPVAIFSSPEIDAAAIEPGRLTLSGSLPALGAHGRPFAHILDVDADGLDDLVVQFTCFGMSPDGDGTVRLSGRTIGGYEIGGSDVVTIRPPGGVEGVDQGAQRATREPGAFGLRVFPNPARGPIGVSLSLAGTEPATVELLDVLGRRVDARRIAGGSASARVTLAQAGRMAPGRYLVRVVQGSRVVTRPVAFVP